MRLKKFLSAILSFVMVFTLFGDAMTTSAATVKLDSELTAAKKRQDLPRRQGTISRARSILRCTSR